MQVFGYPWVKFSEKTEGYREPDRAKDPLNRSTTIPSVSQANGSGDPSLIITNSMSAQHDGRSGLGQAFLG